jgi:hypothetical protein
MLTFTNQKAKAFSLTRVWLIGSVLTFAAPILLWLFSDQRSIGAQWNAIFEWHFWSVIYGLIPLSILAGWRSFAYSKRLMSGSMLIWRPAMEGFISGFLLIFISLWIAAGNEALAAGTIYDGAATWSVSEWFWFLKETSFMGLLIGIICAIWLTFIFIVVYLQIKLAQLKSKKF